VHSSGLEDHGSLKPAPSALPYHARDPIAGVKAPALFHPTVTSEKERMWTKMALVVAALAAGPVSMALGASPVLMWSSGASTSGGNTENTVTSFRTVSVCALIPAAGPVVPGEPRCPSSPIPTPRAGPGTAER